MDSRPYDMVVYGASGFTGQFVAIEAVRICPDKKIAVAGRMKEKLEKVIERIKTELGKLFLYPTFLEAILLKMVFFVFTQTNLEYVRLPGGICLLKVNY